MSDLTQRLRERAGVARRERTATALGDALHFEEAAETIEKLSRTVAARNRRILRLIGAMDHARSQGVVFPAASEPPLVASGDTHD